MADQQGQNMYNGGNSEVIIDQWGDLQADFQPPSTPDALQEFNPNSQSENSQNEAQACDELKPLKNCSWVDCSEQVHLIIFEPLSAPRGALYAIMRH